MTDWLIDKSALWKLSRSTDYGIWIERINRGMVSVSLPTYLEVAVSARDPAHWPTLKRDMLAPLLDVHASLRSEVVATEIMDALVEARLHRTVSLPDVLIASIAVVEGLTLLHDDRDFERIEEVFGRPASQRLSLR